MNININIFTVVNKSMIAINIQHCRTLYYLLLETYCKKYSILHCIGYWKQNNFCYYETNLFSALTNSRTCFRHSSCFWTYK